MTFSPTVTALPTITPWPTIGETTTITGSPTITSQRTYSPTVTLSPTITAWPTVTLWPTIGGTYPPTVTFSPTITALPTITPWPTIRETTDVPTVTQFPTDEEAKVLRTISPAPMLSPGPTIFPTIGPILTVTSQPTSEFLRLARFPIPIPVKTNWPTRTAPTTVINSRPSTVGNGQVHSFKSNTRFRTCRDDHQEQVANQMQTHPEAEIAFVYAVESNLDITNFLNFIEDFILDSVANATLSCLQSLSIVPFPTRKLHKSEATLVRYPSAGDVSHISKFRTHFSFHF